MGEAARTDIKMIKHENKGKQGNQTQRKTSITTLGTRTFESMSEASARQEHLSHQET